MKTNGALAPVPFRDALRDPADETARLVCADWLEEHDRPREAARLRWWVAARAAVRAGVVWDGGADMATVERAVRGIGAAWVRRLYAVEVARLVRGKFPLSPEQADVAAVADETLFVAELYALGLATDEERIAAESAAWSAARSAAGSAAGSVAWSAAWSAAGSVAWSAAWSAARIAAWSAAAWGAAWGAAWSAAKVLSAIPVPAGCE